MKTYIEIIRELRHDHDLSQSAVARHLNTTQQVYSRYETGENEMPIRHLISLSELYCVTTDYILGISKEKPRSS